MVRFSIGIDVGGTNIKLGLINAAGRIKARSRLNTKTFIRHKNELIDALVAAIDDLIVQAKLTRRQIRGIGIGLPGLINPQKGLVVFLPNIPGWNNVPLKKILEKKLGIKTFLDNDVKVITLAEWKYGAGRGCENFVCMTLGTGVGSGLVLDNHLYRGEGFVAGELGHMPLNEHGPACPCGGFGCYERYVGNAALKRKAEQIFKNKAIDLPDIFDLAHRGDKRAVRFWHEAAVHIGNGLVGIVNLLNPRRIIIGGGVSNNFQIFKRDVEKIIKQRSMAVQGKMVKIVKAQLGDDAGLIDALSQISVPTQKSH